MTEISILRHIHQVDGCVERGGVGDCKAEVERGGPLAKHHIKIEVRAPGSVCGGKRFDRRERVVVDSVEGRDRGGVDKRRELRY